MFKLSFLKILAGFLKSLVWGLFILFICSIPTYKVNKVKIFNIDYFDKLAHLLLYYIFSIILYVELINYKKVLKKKFKIYLYILPIPLFWGILIEMMQYHILVSRNGSIYDIIANTCGIILGLFTIIIFRRYFAITKL